MFKKIAFGIVLTLILSAVAGTYWAKVDSEKKLDAIQERFRASGAPMTMAEALPDPVAPELNAAPLYLELEALIAEYSFSDEIYDKLIDPSNDEIYFEDIYQFKVSDEDWLIVEAILRDDRLVAQLELITQIAARPSFQPAWKYEEGPSMLISEVSIGRNVSRYLLVLASQAVRSGDLEAANSYLSQVLMLSKHFEQGQVLITYLTGIAIRGMASQFIEAASLEIGDAAAFDYEVWIHRSYDYWNGAMDSERLVMGKVIFEAMIHGDSDAFGKLTGEPVPVQFHALRLPPFASYFRYDYLHYLKFMEGERHSTELYYAGYVQRSKELNDALFGPDRHRYMHVLSEILTPAMVKVREIVFKSDAQNIVNRTALLLAKYHSDTGAYPESLAELIPQYMETIPADLFSGAPLLYRNEATGFALYSIGPNMKDDGGRTNEQGSADHEYGDVIWAGAGSTLVRTEED